MARRTRNNSNIDAGGPSKEKGFGGTAQRCARGGGVIDKQNAQMRDILGGEEDGIKIEKTFRPGQTGLWRSVPKTLKPMRPQGDAPVPCERAGHFHTLIESTLSKTLWVEWHGNNNVRSESTDANAEKKAPREIKGGWFALILGAVKNIAQKSLKHAVKMKLLPRRW